MTDHEIDPDAWGDARRDAQHDDEAREKHEREVRLRHISGEIAIAAECATSSTLDRESS